MKKVFTRLCTMTLGCLTAAAAWADVPFRTTQLTEEGEFADTTTWYTLEMGSSGMFISDNGEAEYITMQKTETTLADADLWCFTGNETDGFRIYNKAAGPEKALASPVAMKGTTGGQSYAILMPVEGLADDHINLWDFREATSASGGAGLSVENGWYVSHHGTQANTLNIRDGKLAFWTGGYDNGSAIVLKYAKGTLDVRVSTGTFTASNDSKTWHANWRSNQTDPQVDVNSGLNNMAVRDDNIAAYAGLGNPQTYTLQASDGYAITGYSFDFCTDVNSGSAPTITAGETSMTSTAEDQHFAQSGLKEQSAEFVLSGGNYGILLKNFRIELSRSLEEVEPQFNVFTTENSSDIPYRIPAITKAHNGDLIAVADYRYGRADIGMGSDKRLDLRGRISKDNGETWGDIFTIADCSQYVKGSENTSEFLHSGFGDPAIVADRESDRVLLLSCSGDVSFPSGTRNNHQGIARFYSEDNGQTWSVAEDISESIYTQFDQSAIGSARAMFVGSGRIFQSPTVKVGEYYRLYLAVLFKDVNSVNKNYVLYSDDFGGSWNVLGGVDVAPIPSGADEPKTEELPDGSILCSSRMAGGRYFNIFSFTDSEKAEGSWGTVATSNSSNSGIIAANCNGEVMIVPAVRKEDGKEVFLALHSVPADASSRRNVSIYYKELESLADFDTPANFAKDWDGSHRASKKGSAYSTMTLQEDNTIGFLFEEETFMDTSSGGYTIVYKNYSIETITDSLYAYNAESDRDAFTAEGAEAKVENIGNYVGDIVGNLKEESYATIQSAYNEYAAAPSKALYEALNKAIAEAECVGISQEIKYRLRNSERKNASADNAPYYLVAQANKMTAAALDENNENQLFSFIEGEEEGTWYIYSEAQQKYVGQTGQQETEIPLSSTASYAYVVNSSIEGLSSLSCTNPGSSSITAIHLAGDCTRLVPWYASGSPASLWYIEPTDISTAIKQIESTLQESDKPEIYYDLSGRRVDSPKKGGIYVTSRKRKVILQ